MKNASKPQCALCRKRDCYDGKDCFSSAERHRGMYRDERTARLHGAATAIEGRHYCEETRIGEIILFAREMGFGKLGLAYCIGMAEEAEVVSRMLSRGFEVVSVCCKVGGIEKSTFGLERIRDEREVEVMCNPAGQADILNRAGTELNVVCGLCVGHDAVFSMMSDAPVTTLIVKDRVLAHNPAGAIYCKYVREKFLPAEAGSPGGALPDGSSDDGVTLEG